MPRSTATGYRQCQSLVRGLELLAALNRLHGGAASISELTRQTDLHRTTVKRLLETLRDEGYVGHDVTTNEYRVALKVQQLSCGYRDPVMITEVARPILRELAKEVVWPCSILTSEADEMVVRASTRSYSRLSFHPGLPGRRLPMLRSAAGRAYFANIPAEEREALLSVLRSRDDAEGEYARQAAVVRDLVANTQRKGFASNEGEWSEEPTFGGLAVPVYLGGQVAACLNVIYLLRALKASEDVRSIVSALQAAAGRIGQKASSIAMVTNR